MATIIPHSIYIYVEQHFAQTLHISGIIIIIIIILVYVICPKILIVRHDNARVLLYLCAESFCTSSLHGSSKVWGEELCGA